MPVFEYRALNLKGKNTAGVLDAESAQAVRSKLRNLQMYPVFIRELLETASEKSDTGFFKRRLRIRIGLKDIAIMTRQLATLLAAGFPIVSALDSLIRQTKSQRFKKLLTRLKDSVLEGNSLADALACHPEIFSAHYVSIVQAGETSGTLEIVLERLADILEKQRVLLLKLRAALIYPILMTLVGLLVLFFLLTYIVPSIAVVFADMNRALPKPTLWLIATGNFLKNQGWIILTAGMALLLVYQKTKNLKPVRRFYDNILFRAPWTGGLVRKIGAARFARTLGSLLENGVSLLPALGIVTNIVGNVKLAEAVAKASEGVGMGRELHQAMTETAVFPDLFIQMLQVGENSGELESILQKTADLYETEVETTLIQMTTLIEPFMILLMGIVVGFIVLSICLPIFEMNQLII